VPAVNAGLEVSVPILVHVVWPSRQTSVRGDLFIGQPITTNPPPFCFSAPKAFGAEKQKGNYQGCRAFYKQGIPNGIFA